MNPFAAILARLMEPAITPEAIRAEIFFLGSRHRGEALGGALEELGSADIKPRRLRLLRAVVNHLARSERRARTAAVAPPR